MQCSVNRPSLIDTAAFGIVLIAALAYAAGHLPAEADYRLGADEGVYYRQALTLLREGQGGLARLGAEYVRGPAEQIGPPPLRIGHLAAAAAFLAVRPAIGTLSILSLVCHALLSIAVFLFAAQLWDRRVATLAGIFTAVSPLGLGLGTRALMDTDHALFSAVALFTLVRWLVSGRERDFVLFAVALGWSMLVKETAWIHVPFAAVTILIATLAGRDGIRPRHVVIVAIAVPAAVAFVLAVAFGGPIPAFEVIEAARHANVSHPNPYLVAYGSGPWYEYLVDFLVLSPVVTILFFLFCGRTIAAGRRDLATTLMVLFVCYGILALAPVAKNPRFALPLDPLLRIGAAAMVVATASERRTAAARTALAVLLPAAIVATDVRAFDRFFVKGRIYDPVAANLLSAVGSLPVARTETAGPDPRAADEYLNLSLAYYRARDFRAAVRMAQRAIALQPDSADAYNNLGAAYCELGEWQAAIDALQTALRLRPEFPLARNNLAWARSRLR
jgi:hypothetical protein